MVSDYVFSLDTCKLILVSDLLLHVLQYNVRCEVGDDDREQYFKPIKYLHLFHNLAQKLVLRF